MEKNKLMMIVIILILAIMLGAVIFGFVFISQMIRSELTPPGPGESASGSISFSYELTDMRLITLSDSIKANLLRDTDGREHLALVNVQIGIAGSAEATKNEKKQNDKELDNLEEILISREPVIRDIIIRRLARTTYSDLRGADGAEMLERAITSELQNVFNTNYIVRTFFVELFLQ